MMTSGNVIDLTHIERTSKKTGRPFKVYSAVMDDGETYEIGFKPGAIRKGMKISFDWEVSYGKKAIKDGSLKIDGAALTSADSSPIASTPVASTPSPAGASKGSWAAKVFPVPPTHGDRSIIRQNALARATELFLHFHPAPAEGTTTATKMNKMTKQIIELAYSFEEYTTGQLELDAAKKLTENMEADKDA